jgi:hypothetical protein
MGFKNAGGAGTRLLGLRDEATEGGFVGAQALSSEVERHVKILAVEKEGGQKALIPTLGNRWTLGKELAGNGHPEHAGLPVLVYQSHSNSVPQNLFDYSPRDLHGAAAQEWDFLYQHSFETGLTTLEYVTKVVSRRQQPTGSLKVLEVGVRVAPAALAVNPNREQPADGSLAIMPCRATIPAGVERVGSEPGLQRLNRLRSLRRLAAEFQEGSDYVYLGELLDRIAARGQTQRQILREAAARSS